MPFDLSAERVLPLLEARGGELASDAQTAWDSLTASGDVSVVSLHSLEYFLWYTLPAKFFTSPEDHRAIALALGTLLSELGYEGAAALCRSPVTMRVIAAWDHGPSRGHQALSKALDDSGVEPLDTEALEWGGMMGMTKSSVYELAAGALEEALLRGEVIPGKRGWKQAQAEVLRQFLTAPADSLDQRTPQAAVWQERQDFWVEPPARPLRQAFIRPIREEIRRRPAARPEAMGEGIRPLLRLLELCTTGLPLTSAGYMPPGTVRELVGELGWWDWDKPPRSETDAPQLIALRDFAHKAGLVRRAHDRLHLTVSGRRALVEPDRLWTGVVRALSDGTHFAAALRELLLVRMLQGDVDRKEVVDEVLPVLVEAGWRPSDGRGLSGDVVSSMLWDAIRPMELLGMILAGKWPDRTLRLIGLGNVTARAVLWRRSTAPRHDLR